MTTPDHTAAPSDLDAIEQSLDDLLATVGTDGGGTPASEPAPSSLSADVTADPQTATYSTDTATAPAPTEPAPVAEPTDPALSSESTDTSINAAIGVDGGVDYFSPRDVDGDGSIDVVHSRVDGIDTITNYGEDGEITLIEQDTDGNGTYETAASQDSDGTIREATDLDDDGYVDLVTNIDPETGAPVRQEVLAADGRIDQALLDTTGDGAPDTNLIDTDGDGRFDTAIVDTDGDSITNETRIDTDGDGHFDLLTADGDNDGTQETVLTAGEPGGLGGIDAFESEIPADDAYHAQAGTYPEDSASTQDTHTDL